MDFDDLLLLWLKLLQTHADVCEEYQRRFEFVLVDEYQDTSFNQYKIMKIAIIHNALDTIGGAEKLTLSLAKYLNAKIYTTNIDKQNCRRERFNCFYAGHDLGDAKKNANTRQNQQAPPDQLNMYFIFIHYIAMSVPS